MDIKNRLSRPVSQASGEFNRVNRPVGYFAAYRDLLREFSAIVDIVHRVNIRRIPQAYGVPSRFVVISSWLLGRLMLFSAVVVTPVVFVIGLISTIRLIRCGARCRDGAVSSVCFFCKSKPAR